MGDHMQGFYVNMVYHSYAIAYGGDKAVLNETGWVQDWVSLMTQVQESDVCQVHACLALPLSTSRVLHCCLQSPMHNHDAVKLALSCSISVHVSFF